MYSNPSSFLGSGSTSLPVGFQYHQPASQQLPQPPSNEFSAQSTSYEGPSLQPQYTGLPSQSQLQNFSATPQSQYSGYPPRNQMSFQGTSVQEPDLRKAQQAPAQTLPQRTTQTSSQVAQSFQGAVPLTTPVDKTPINGVKIPKIRLSFLTAQDQAKFEQLFKSAVGDGQALDGNKVRDLLVRSKLSGTELMHIWLLSDTTKSGQLLFPEFALAMYLCNLKLVGKELPPSLPEKIANEVSSMVDIISFGVPDDQPQAKPQSNVSNLNLISQGTGSPSIQQPQPQTPHAQLLTQLSAQPTGFGYRYVPPQATGLQQPQFSALNSYSTQPLGLQQPQQSGLQQSAALSGYSDSTTRRPSIPTASGPNQAQSQGGGFIHSSNAQPTAGPGRWGLVNAPASGLPNIDALQQRMMPQPGRESGYTTIGLSGSATVPWAVTKDEKRIYDDLFKEWDGLNKGYLGGDVAIEAMSQSGLEKLDLERIWTLADPGNKGRLDMDEFAVAMHLIYRKLNGYPVPNRLPPELVPPSTRNFADSIGTVKSLLSQDAEFRKNNGDFLQPQRTGISYLKTHSFRSEPRGVSGARQDATVFRNNDDHVGYKSSARRRLAGGGRTPSPSHSESPRSEMSSDEFSAEQLRKEIREKQVLLDAIDSTDENASEDDYALDRKDRREAEELYRRIRRIQQDIDGHPKGALRVADSEAERRVLGRQLQASSDRLSEVASSVRRVERSVADTKLELFRLKDAKKYPDSASGVIGTGPGGSITEADRLKARAKAMMEQRSAMLTGKGNVARHDSSPLSPSLRLEEENSLIRVEKQKTERMVQDVEDSVKAFSQGIEESLKDFSEGSHKEHEKHRWEDGLGVEEEIRDFIFELQRGSRASRIRFEDLKSERNSDTTRPPFSQVETNRNNTPTPHDSKSDRAKNALTGSRLLSASTYSSYKTAEERAAYIKQQAEQRMAERLAALGLKPPTQMAESNNQTLEREERDREQRLRQAQAEDAQRDRERSRRLQNEQTTTSTERILNNKKPPPPPSRKHKAGTIDERPDAQYAADPELLPLKIEQESKERIIEEQRNVQEAGAEELQDKALQQEGDLARERELAQARLKSLEAQVQARKTSKQEEKRRRQAVDKEAKEKEAKLAIQRAELEDAKERERQLQLQLEGLAESSSEDENALEHTPQDNTPTNSQILSKDTLSLDASAPSRVPDTPQGRQSSGPALAIATPSSVYSSETKNPFFKKLSQSNESQSIPTSRPAPSITSPGSNEISTNPFHRLTQQENANKSSGLGSSQTAGSRPSRVRPEEDEWSVVDSTEDSSDDGEEVGGPTGGSAKQLASMLFGTMAPPRPLPVVDERSPSTPSADSESVPIRNSPAPVMPKVDGPSIDSPAPLAPPLPMIPGPAAAAPPLPAPPLPSFHGTLASTTPLPTPKTDSIYAEGPPTAPPPPPPIHQGRVGPTTVDALLGDIVKGKGLKKVETKDRSQAVVAGRVLG